MLTRWLIVLVYLIVLLELLLDDRLLGIRYLHFAYLAFYLTTTALFVYLVIHQQQKGLWFLPAFLWVSFHYLQPFISSKLAADKQDTYDVPVSILSFSVNSRNRQYQQVAHLLKQYPADIVCLQEIPFSRYHLFIEQLQAAKLNYQHIYSKKKSLMILSPHPITPKKTIPFLQATIDIGNNKIRVWNIHSPKSLTRKHFQRFYFEKLKQDIESDKSPLKLLCGDFNSTPHNDILPMFSGILQRAHLYKTQPIAFTYPTPEADHIPSPIPLLKIDYILLNKPFHIDRYARLAQYAHSDHYPVMAHATIRSALPTPVNKP